LELNIKSEIWIHSNVVRRLRLARGADELIPPQLDVEFAVGLKESMDQIESADEEGNKALDKEILYSLLKKDTSLLENDTLRAFYDETSVAHSGIISQIMDLINEKNYSDVETKLETLTMNTEAETVNKEVYSIMNFAEQREAYILTNEELEILMNIANFCPIKYGQGVYSARVMIRSQPGYETSTWDDEELCISGIDYRRANPDDEHLTQYYSKTNYLLYPNPASNELTFKIQNIVQNTSFSKSKIEIFDILGNVMLKKESDFAVSINKIDVTSLVSGAYLFEYTSGNNLMYRQTFVINK
jgi:hypothetical protein